MQNTHLKHGDFRGITSLRTVGTRINHLGGLAVVLFAVAILASIGTTAASAHGGSEAEQLEGASVAALVEQVVALLRAEQPGAELRLELILERSEIEEFDRGSLEEALAAIRAGQDEQALDLILQARPTPPTTTSTITKTQATAPPAGATGGSEEPPTTTPTTEQTGESAGPDGTAAGPAEEAAVEGVQVERSPGVAETGGVILVAGLLLLGLFARQDRSATDAGTSTTSSR